MSDDPTNPDEEATYPDEEQAPEDPDAGHDDIMKRLVDYQRQLREGVEPTEAAAVAWHLEPRESGRSDRQSSPRNPKTRASRGAEHLLEGTRLRRRDLACSRSPVGGRSAVG